VLASLRAGANRRQIFVTQAILQHVDKAARSTRTTIDAGLLLGGLFECPVSGSKYVLIESLKTVSAGAPDLQSTLDALAGALSSHRGRATAVIGWFCARGRGDELLPEEETVYRTIFIEPWQTALVLTAPTQATVSATFFQRDALDGRPFRAPFFEVLDPSARLAPNGAKPTRIAWSTYLTAEPVIASPPPNDGSRLRIHAIPDASASDSPWTRWRRQRDAKSARPGLDTRQEPASNQAESRVHQTGLLSRGTPSPQLAAVASLGSGPTPTGLGSEWHGAADAALEADTSVADRPARFLELARADGFFLTTSFRFTPNGRDAETLWVLQDPFYGLLLTVVTDATAVIDATLRYNVHTTDRQVLGATFSAHRDIETGTLYAQESCIDALRARCAALRSSGALLAEWMVAPTIHFLTPGEWASFTATGTSAAAGDLNRQRIRSLPEPVVQRFRLETQRPT
jgi:hypothetical protein